MCSPRPSRTAVAAVLVLVLAGASGLAAQVPAAPASAQNDIAYLTRYAQQLQVGDIEDLERRASAGEAVSQTVLALAYHEGRLLKYDPNQAIELFRKAAEQDFVPAQEALGMAYQVGKDVEKRPSHALLWYTRAAERGSTLAASNLGMMYLNGDGVAQDRAEAFKWFSKAADAGEVTSQMNAGLMLLRGQVVNADPAKGMQWVRRAAEGGFAPAQFELALIDQRGTPPVNPAEALRMLLKAADQAYAPALTQLGYTFRTGIGVPPDPVQSLMWYRMAAEKGEPIAAYAVSVHFLSAKPADYAEGFRWTVIAANGGHAEAQYNAGMMCEEGVGTVLDLREAARWYKLAADQGSSDAQYRLGRLYVEGTGMPRDDVAGYMWLFLAKDAISESGALLHQLQPKMTPTQIKQSEQAIDDWRINHLPKK